MTPRPSRAGAEPEVPSPSLAPPALGRGDHFPVQATVLRLVGPWVQLQVLGETVQVLRSTLDKELANHGR